MKAIFRNLIGAAALVGVTTLVTTLVTTQVVSQHEEPGMDEMMEQWMKFAAPGPEHAKLAKFAGKWNQESTHWMYPGAEPNVSHSVATFKPILGGRFMLETLEGKMNFNGQDMSFEAMGIIGYDNMKKKHFYAWVDNMGTMMMVAEGTENADGDIVYYSEIPDPMSGGTMKLKSVSRIVSNQKTVFEMYQEQPDGTWFKQMELVGTKKY